MTGKWFVSGMMFVFLIVTSVETTLASFVIQSQDVISIELKGYNGLTDTTLFEGKLSGGVKNTIDTPYYGLALLLFEKGQSYPVIIGDKPFTLKIVNPAEPPSFEGSDENDFFYSLLASKDHVAEKSPFALLMIQAKQLLESSSSVRTINHLTEKKKEFHEFVSANYDGLKHSDMVRRLIAQYFMMHEYVDYYVEGAPATIIKIRYQEEIINGVENWIKVLKAHIPDHKVLNYCVSLYYNRSMVSLAHLIVSNFKDIAYCPGNIEKSVRLPENLSVADEDGNKKWVLKDLGNGAVISFVSEDCSVSMVETVVKARRLASQKKDVKLIVAPLQQLSDKHLAMRRMLTSENMFFVNDEEWRTKKMPKDIRLPLFIHIATSKF